MSNNLKDTPEWKDFITEIKTSIMPQIRIYANLEVEADIVKAIFNNIFSPNVLKKRYRELLEEEIENKSFTYWGSNCYIYKSIVDEILFESVSEDIIDFLDHCFKVGRYNDLLSKYLIPPDISEDDYNESLIDFCEEIHYDNSIFLNSDNIELFKTNPLISDVYDKYNDKIVEYKISLSSYDLKEYSFLTQLENDLEHIEKPNIYQKITKKDKKILKFLTDTYSKYEIALLIRSKNIIVSNSIAEKYAITFPFEIPSIDDYITVEKVFKYK